jgi:hypothetical protein
MIYDVFEEMFVVFNFNVSFVPYDFSVHIVVFENLIVVLNFNVFFWYFNIFFVLEEMFVMFIQIG